MALRRVDFRVRRISRAELVEFYTLREMLESYVMRTLCQLIDERSLRLLGHVLERQEMAGEDVARFIGLDEEFHLSLAQLAGLPRTARIISSLRGVLWLMGTRLVASEIRRRHVVAEHRAVLAALERRDPEAACAAIQHHVRATAEAALSAVAEYQTVSH